MPNARAPAVEAPPTVENVLSDTRAHIRLTMVSYEAQLTKAETIKENAIARFNDTMQRPWTESQEPLQFEMNRAINNEQDEVFVGILGKEDEEFKCRRLYITDCKNSILLVKKLKAVMQAMQDF